MTANVTQDRLAPARRLAEFTLGLAYEDLPDHVVDFTKGLIVKMVAAELGGSTTDSASKLARLTASRGLRPDVGVAGFGFKTALWDAVLQNVFTAHCSELEDVAHTRGGLSWDVTVIPLALSLGEREHHSGRELIAAVAAGLEVQYRSSEPFDAVPAGFVLPPHAAMGCAAAAAKGLKLDTERTVNAMGIALSTSAMAEVSMGTDAHFFESALHAYQGVAAAEMAASGLTGNPDLTSFTGIRAPAVHLDDVTDGLGDRWWFAETWIKKYPLCFLVHRQVDALLELVADNGLAYDDIASVEVLTGLSDVSCDRPEPRTVGDLMFSIQHAVGAAMLDGAIELAAVREEAADDPRYVAARSKVSVVIDDSEAPDFQMGVPTTLTVRTTDGRRLVGRRVTARGAPDEPLDRLELDSIFRRYGAGTLPEDELEDLLGTLWTIEELDNVAAIGDVLTKAGTVPSTT
jgi:2-methylcitrate dehydratase PrpD